MAIRSRNLELALVVAVALSGCDSPQHAVSSGVVTLNGKPVEGGVISFIPTAAAKGAPVWADIRDGSYSLSDSNGLTVGKNRVEIRWQKKTGRKVVLRPPARQDSPVEETAEAIPTRYNANSELQVEVKQGKNNFDFKLE